MKDFIEKYDGRKVILGGEEHIVLGKVGANRAYRLRAPDGREHELPNEEFRLLVASGSVLDGNDQKRIGHPARPGQRGRELEFRGEVIHRLMQLEQEGFSWAERHEVLSAEMSSHGYLLSTSKPFPTIRTLQTWRKAWLEGGLKGLRSNYDQAGNRRPRYDRYFEKIVLDDAEDNYLSSDRKTLWGLTESARKKYLDFCARTETKPKACGVKAVKTIIETLPHVDIVKLRLGSDEARRRFLVAQDLQRVEAPLDRVEIDCTTADIKVVNDEGELVGRPTICAAIDGATAKILGLKLSLDAPNAELVARTLKEVVTPQSTEFFDRFKIQNRVQTYGTPQMIVSDQGSENSGPVIEAIVERLGLEWQKCIPGQPQKKPFVERLFRDISLALAGLPGATKTKELDPHDRATKSEEEASLTFDDVEEFLQRWRYDVYAVSPRRRVQSALRVAESPLKAWKRLAEEFDIPEPPSQREVEEIFFRRIKPRRLHLYGVEVDRIQYSSSELRRHITAVGPKTTVDVYRDPTDIRSILVHDTKAGVRLRVPAKDPEIPAISVSELDAVRKRMKPDNAEYLAGRDILRELVRQFEEKPAPGTSKQRASKKREAKKRRAGAVATRSLRPENPKVAKSLVEDFKKPAQLKRPGALPETQQRRR